MRSGRRWRAASLRVLVDQGDVGQGRTVARRTRSGRSGGSRRQRAAGGGTRGQHDPRGRGPARRGAEPRATRASRAHVAPTNCVRRGSSARKPPTPRDTKRMPRRRRVDAAAAQLAAARRDHDRALADVAGVGKLRAQARLVSPVDGVVSARLVEPGTTIVAGQAVLQVIDPATLWIKARIDQGQAGGVRVGQPAEIVLRSDAKRAYRGEVAARRLGQRCGDRRTDRQRRLCGAAGRDLGRRAGRGDDPHRRTRQRTLGTGGGGEAARSAGRRLASRRRPRRVPAGEGGHHDAGRAQPDSRRPERRATRSSCTASRH